jgi:tetrapyrrole methylase family protein/MazG family protein
VVGLGPAGPAYLTGEVRDLMAHAGQTILRTARHPAAEGLSGVTALDAIYESADTFGEVYEAIVEELVRAAVARAPEPIVYAVPGSPLVAERTVELLRHDPRVELTVVPGLSFLDLAWERLGVDPLAAGVRLVDAAELVRHGANGEGPFLVAQCWSQALLSEIKLSPLYDGEGAVPEVVLLHHLGLADEQVLGVGWWDLDRALKPDHLTSLYLPALPARAELKDEMARLAELVETLRARCPWDNVQTHGSLMPHLLEESYEVLDALREFDVVADGEAERVASAGAHLQEELGDLLFQIVFHARLAQESGTFTLAEVARGVREKLVHRHPHVFGDVAATSTESVVANWEEIKKEEKGRTSVTEGIPTDLPALLLSTKLQRKGLSVGLPGLDEVAADVAAHAAALAGRRVDPRRTGAEATNAERQEDAELVGQVLFEVAGLARRLGVDPELALRWRALALRDDIVQREQAVALHIADTPTH